MQPRTEIASFRVKPGTVARLKMIAHRLSLGSGKDVTWSSILREVLEQNLLVKDVGAKEQTN
jgi:hypothetical protein